MTLSAPIYRLKRQARLLSREAGIPLCEALDRVAIGEGFRAWSELSAAHAGSAPAAKLYPQLRPGDLVLIGARPGQGKTMLALELAIEAMKAGHRSVFFTLEYAERDFPDRLPMDLAPFRRQFEGDCSDQICADYILGKLSSADRGTVVVIDYLQLLDQRRETPDLMDQVRSLRVFAKERGVTLIFISQVDRSYDPSSKPCPDLDDIRLPNPLDLKLFDKAVFLHDGDVRF